MVVSSRIEVHNSVRSKLLNNKVVTYYPVVVGESLAFFTESELKRALQRKTPCEAKDLVRPTWLHRLLELLAL